MSVYDTSGAGDTLQSDKCYKIKHPSTTKDDGSPSDDLFNDCRRILHFIDDERHLPAQQLLTSVHTRLDVHPGKAGHPTKHVSLLKRKKLKKELLAHEEEYRKIDAFLAVHRVTLDTLEKKAALFKRALDELQKNDDWIFSQTLFGVTTYYRKEADGSLSIKMEGQLHDVPIFEQLAIVREVDLHQTWAPFCTSSMTIKEMDKLDTIGWFVLGAPQLGLARDGIFRAIGCDNMAEEGSILIVGQGIDDRPDDEPYAESFLTEGLEGLELPEKPTRMGSGRLTIRHFAATIDILSATSLETKLVANIDPNLPLPKSLLDFIMRKMCGVVLSKLQNAAKKVDKDPVRNEHAQRMRQEHEFYKDWLLPKFEAFCKMSHWEMPVVAALFLTEEQQEKEFNYLESRNRGRSLRKASAAMGSTGGNSDDHSQDTISRLTIASKSSTNPIGRYLQEMEEKTAEKKARQISAARQRVANRLKPKHLSDDQLERLKELKEAKERRNRSKGMPRTLIEVETVDRHKKKERKASVIPRFHTHNRKTRFLTATFLCCVMGIVLNPEILIGKFLDSFEDYEPSWWTAVLLDIGTLMYIGFCTIVHFACCDIAMVYAYGALDLGMKTGKQVKKYYSDSVRMLVAGLSGSIAAFSTGKAVFNVTIRAVVWYSIRGLDAAQGMEGRAEVLFGHYLPAAAIRFPGSAFAFGQGVFSFVASKVYMVVSFLSWLFYTVLINSNRIGQFLEMIARALMKLVPSWQSTWNAYVEHVRGVYEDTEVVPTWRSEAIQSTRFLLAYTAVFLLSILVLFNASSRANKRRNEKWHSLNSSVNSELFDSIHETNSIRNESTFGKSSASIDDELSVSLAPMSADTGNSGRKQRRFKFRLHKKEKNNINAEAESAPVPVQSAVLH
mmetsp:Transcript_5439/g.8929  ORF Transcript_5439/g.8929 Transcript_5439/m.8929 type:complete len:896 (+) Transcript_5439:182-2869(+)|eukprot:CAMPEP_0119017240 /NCGR_PEP_ID=MMETSP1176-20130426/15865_1 /TAXON_ID=265551 /ORGANISM="Synedropsis recta cf, Strain CCMP1620" /LENGTH=895 /DNA_ID=CAMNT_0006970903 /DNA_START=128 /DNA_END=2815 /DNA_ORIENTATION=+